VRTIDLSTCETRVDQAPKASGVLISNDNRFVASVRATGSGKSAKQTIWVTDRRSTRTHAVFAETEYYKTIGPGETPGPIVLLGWSGDDRWIFFTVDPGGSGSIMADGLTLQVVSASGGAAHRLAKMLVYRDYLTWCRGKVVFSAGFDRVATDRKRLLLAGPPYWRPRPVIARSNMSFGSVICSPDGNSVVVQAQPQSSDPSFFATRWRLWRIGFDGTATQLTRSPARSADESPRFSPNGRTLYFVRSRDGNGRLYALRDRRVVGPLLSLGRLIGYYGHRDWPYRVTR